MVTATAATVSRTPVSRLPAPLYFLTSAGQVARLDADGAAQSLVTHAEDGRVVAFALSPSSGALAYLTEPADPTERVLTYQSAAGDVQREVFRGALSSPVFLADDPSIAELDPNSTGQRIAYRVFEPLPDVEPARARPGVFESYDIGMCPYLLVPDDTAALPPRRYLPLALSPDGTRLLVRVERAAASGLAVVQPDETVTEVTTTAGQPLAPACAGCAAWSQDGAAIYVAANVSPGAKAPARAGMWRADAAAGTAVRAWPGEGGESPFEAIAFPRQFPDGQIYFFAAAAGTTKTTAPTTAPYRMVRVSPEAGSAPLVVGSEEWPREVLQWAVWAPDGSGAVAEMVLPASAEGEVGEVRLVWLPTDGRGAALIPAEGYQPGGNIAWGRSSR